MGFRRVALRSPGSCVFLARHVLAGEVSKSALGAGRCLHQPPEDYLDILVATRGGSRGGCGRGVGDRGLPPDLHYSTKMWQVLEKRGEVGVEGNREAEGSTGLQLSATCHRMSITGTLPAPPAILEVEGPRAAD